MANRYANLVGSKKISEDWQNINIGFDRVQADMDTNKGTADAHIANTDIHVTAAKKAEWDSKAPGSTVADLATHKADQVVHVTQADHDKLNGIQEGAQVNQNAFAKVNDIEAADPSDAVTIKGGVGIKVSTNPNTKEVEVTATGDAAPGAHGPTHTEHGADPIPAATPAEGGIMSAAQAAELVAHDELLDEHAAAITALEDRLDTSDMDSVTLQPGLQVVKVAKDARFRLGEIKGKSEINGQGRIGIIGVENPYVIGTSDNLLPPFYEWTEIGKDSTILAPYEHTQAVQSAEWSRIHISVAPNTDYVLSIEGDSNQKVAVVTPKTDIYTFLQYGRGGTFNTREYTEIAIYINGAEAGTIRNITLLPGTAPKPFEPQNKSMLAFQTELHANPSDGSNPDVLFEQGGEYRKLAKWGNNETTALAWVFAESHASHKIVKASLGNALSYSEYVTKYNGKILTRGNYGDLIAASDKSWIDGFSNIQLSVSNADTGWGPDYNPTQDEIKAYFMGWKMCDIADASGHTPYNGTGTKGWFWVDDPASTKSFTTTLPTSYNGGAYGWRPYNLLYRLAKDSVEPVSSEGCLTLAEGVNLVEVGTGIVLREHAPVLEVPGSGAAMGDMSAPTKFKIEHFLTAYKNNRPDYKWYHVAGNAYGLDKARIMWEDYDKSAVYTLTYLKLDKSPIQPITGSLAANEKAQISDLTAGVAEALQRVSVVEMKKAEEDAPGWITPTLLNGAVHGSAPVAYKKVNGMVVMRGIFTSTVGSIPIFRLPVGYRPKDIARFMLMGVSSGQLAPINIEIDTGGNVSVGYIATDYMSLSGVIFEAEQ